MILQSGWMHWGAPDAPQGRWNGRFPAPFKSRFMRLIPASVGQASAASGTATSQNLTPVGSCHTFAESVFLRTLTLLRLIGTNHSDTPPVSISSGVQASANHNSRIVSTVVVIMKKQNASNFFKNPLRGLSLFFCSLGQYGVKNPHSAYQCPNIIAEKNQPCQPKFFGGQRPLFISGLIGVAFLHLAAQGKRGY